MNQCRRCLTDISRFHPALKFCENCKLQKQKDRQNKNYIPHPRTPKAKKIHQELTLNGTVHRCALCRCDISQHHHRRQFCDSCQDYKISIKPKNPTYIHKGTRIYHGCVRVMEEILKNEKECQKIMEACE